MKISGLSIVTITQKQLKSLKCDENVSVRKLFPGHSFSSVAVFPRLIKTLRFFFSDKIFKETVIKSPSPLCIF